MQTFPVITKAKEELIDITYEIKKYIEDYKIKSGVLLVFVLHTTCGLTINENADPDVQDDILLGLRDIVDEKLPYKHLEGNSPAHLKSSLMGSSVQLIVQQGKLVLGTWQGIYLCEFDGPRTRRIAIQEIKTAD